MTMVCITGIGGYLGLATTFKLLEAGFTVCGLGSSSNRPAALPEGVVYKGIDICDTKALANFFAENKVTTVYHLAAIKYVGRCEAEPLLCFKVNTEGTKAVLSAMKEATVPHIIYASSYVVYDWSEDHLVLSEESLLKPATVYGQSKLQSEESIQEAYRLGNITKYHILRYGNIIGAVDQLPAHSPQSFLDKIVHAATSDEAISLLGDEYKTSDGTVARDFIDVRDVTRVTVRLLDTAMSGTFNVASGKATTLKELIAYAEAVTRKVITVTINKKAPTEPSTIIIDCTKLVQAIGFAPKYAVRDSIVALSKKLVT